MDEKIIEDIIKKVMEQLGSGGVESHVPSKPDCVIPVELSARHVHLSEKDAVELFGGPLTKVRDLSQPGQFLCRERVRLIGPKGVIDNVAVLGPARNSSQVEISKTDARILGTEVPVRESGDISGTPGIILASAEGIVGLEEGLIVAMRHIHMTPEDAKRFNVADKQRVSVKIESDRPVILENVIVRVNENFRLAMHIDLDEGNAAGWNKNVTAKILDVCREERSGLYCH
jgi:propanediol utilization protein